MYALGLREALSVAVVARRKALGASLLAPMTRDWALTRWRAASFL